MTHVPDSTQNPAAMTPAQRRQEIAAILSRGVLRLRQIARLGPGLDAPPVGQNLAEDRETRLDEAAELSPHVLAR